MSSETDSNQWGTGALSRKERYREKMVEDARTVLDHQNQVLESQQDSLESFIRYHLLLLGFLYSMAGFGFDQQVELGNWELFIASIPPTAGIFVTLIGLRSISAYKIGPSWQLFEKVADESESYLHALKRMSRHYGEMTGLNRERVDNHQKYRFYNTLLLALGMGCILGAILN